MTISKKPTIFSGVQPTGNLHLGNYLGAISQWVALQDKYQCIFCIVDYHAITVRQDPSIFSRQILDTAKVYLAAGIDPNKSIIFQQSDIKEHTELAWILNCTSARMSDLENMTQYKDKSLRLGSGSSKNVSVGLFDYPVLMASDILLYNTDAVPVGEDQKQHVELARDLAKRFNHDFGDTFKIPEAMIRKEGARIMGLDDPKKKMSKSSGPANYIALTDSAEVATKKIMRAVTDNGMDIIFDKETKPAIANLMTIYSLLTKESTKQIEKYFSGKGYGDFKRALAEQVNIFLSDFQNKFNAISDTEAKSVILNGADLARPRAQATVSKVKKHLGI